MIAFVVLVELFCGGILLMIGSKTIIVWCDSSKNLWTGIAITVLGWAAIILAIISPIWLRAGQ